jgi:ferric-dicitrate binding protein FerR (iron transport regulator)
MLCGVNRLSLAGVVSATCLFACGLSAQDASSSSAATLVSKDNRVDVAGASGGWAAASAGQALHVGDRLKTGEDSRANVRMADGSVLQLDELTTIEIKPPKVANTSATLKVPSGAAYFFSQ